MLADVQGRESVTDGVEVQGMDEWIRRLQKAGDLSQLRGTMQAATLMLQDEIAAYPPESEANVPYQRRWYERGFGPRWLLKDGTVRGTRTSQTLGRKWTTRVSADGLQGVVGNNVTYGPYVQSKAKQTRYHKARGWKTDVEAIEKQRPGIVQLFKDAIERLLG